MSILAWLRNVFGGTSSSDEPTCLACESTDLEVLAADAYRCSSCGHEGGEGLPAWYAAREKAKIEAMSPAERLDLAHRSLSEAQGLMTGASLRGGEGNFNGGDVVIAAAAVTSAVAGAAVGFYLSSNSDRKEEQQRVLGQAFRDLLESEHLLDRAATALADELLIPPMERLSVMPLHLDQASTHTKLTQAAQVLYFELQRLEGIARER
jgi:hypothetical protein